MCKVNQCSILLVFISYVVHVIIAQDASREDWTQNVVVNSFPPDDSSSPPNFKPILSSALSELTKKASVEFDKLCHQLESVLKQLTFNEPVRVTQLYPTAVNRECKCFCLCPQNTKVIDDIKVKVMGLKERFFSLGRSIKEKIHELTAK